MKIAKADLTPEIVDMVLKYDPITGTLTWCSKHHSKRVVVGSRAGNLHKSTGYREVTVFGVKYPEHVICWFLYHRKWPAGQIDHANHKRDDNRISNLNDLTFLQNMRNRAQMKNTVSGMQGIWFNKKRNRWVAEITMDGKKVYQKSFTEQSKALEARRLKLIELGFHENHGS